MTENRPLPYRLREPFLTTVELALFRLLVEIMGGRYAVLPKVALNDIFYIVRPNENVHFFNKIFRKHIDFLLCDQKSMKPRFGVEIVKPATKDSMRIADKFMEELFLDAGLPLIQIPSNDEYKATDIISLFQVAMTKVEATTPLRLNNKDSVPNCPKCGKMMVLRIQRNGTRANKIYYGCIDNPHCEGVVTIE